MRVQMPLLEYLLHCSQPDILSDLRILRGLERVRVIRMLEQITPEAAALEEWNNALEYLVKQPPEETAAAARERLLHCLKHLDDLECSEDPGCGAFRKQDC